MTAPRHPSFHALDRVALGGVDEETTHHVATCAACRDHVAGVRVAPSLPPWLATVRREAPAPRLRSLPKAGLLAAPLLAACLALVLWIRQPGEQPVEVHGVREKGTPVVTTFVKRGDEVRPWDGRSPIRPGDLLRLRVQGADGAYLSVAALPSDGGKPAVLFEGKLADSLLPMSFRVDGLGREETIDLVIAPHPPTPDLHRREQLPASHWRRRLTFAKEILP